MNKKQNITIKSDSIIGTKYAQLVSVTVTDVDITLEFAYINPRVKTVGHVVSRVTLPRTAGEKLSTLIQDVVLQHESKKKNTN